MSICEGNMAEVERVKTFKQYIDKLQYKVSELERQEKALKSNGKR